MAHRLHAEVRKLIAHGRAVAALACVCASVLAGAGTSSADSILYQNGFESADTCAWSTTEPPAGCDPEMVFVPEGEFPMGQEGGDPDQLPVHAVSLDAFWIDRTEVTVDAFLACKTAGSCTTPDAASNCNSNHADRGAEPFNCATWDQATAYCTWAGKRLPTEAEWEKAARGVDGRTYPWGEDTPTCSYAVISDPNAHGAGCGSHTTLPDGSKPGGESPYGALDMTGNVWEWVNDWYGDTYYSTSPASNPPGPESGTYRVFRGGGLFDSVDDLQLPAAFRSGSYPFTARSDVGFRCAR